MTSFKQIVNQMKTFLFLFNSPKQTE